MSSLGLKRALRRWIQIYRVTHSTTDHALNSLYQLFNITILKNDYFSGKHTITTQYCHTRVFL